MKTKTILSKTKLLTLFVCIALTITLMLAIGSFKSHAETSDTHTHNACGEETCTHEGTAHSTALEYTALTKEMLLALPTETLESGEAGGLVSNPFAVIPGGNYYLTENITITSSSNYLLMREDVNLCLNGFTLSTLYLFIQDGTLTISDCSAEQSGIFHPASGNFGIEIGTSTASDKNPALNLYSGTVKGGNVIRCWNGELNIYGGNVTCTSSGTNIAAYPPSTVNIYGGTFTTEGRNFNLNPQSNKNLTLNIYDGTFTADLGIIYAGVTKTSPVTNSQININISGGDFSFNSDAMGIWLASLASPTAVINANINGGTYRTKEVNEIVYHAFYAQGWSNLTVTKMNMITEGSVICADPLANVTLDPQQDSDIYAEVAGTGNSSIIYNTSLANADILNAAGNAVTPADYGKIIIKGGTFVSATARVVSAQIPETKTEIWGGNFNIGSTQYYAVTVSKNAEVLIKGGNFNITSNFAYILGKLKIEGSPSITGIAYITNSILDENGDYKLDTSGYTGTKKIKIGIYNTNTASPTLVSAKDMILAKGSADKLEFENTDWVLTNTQDTADTPNAVVMLACAEHKGDPAATCASAGICTVCGDSYMLAHDFSISEKTDDEHWKKCSKCNAISGKTAHSYKDGKCTCGQEKPGLSGGAIAGIVIGSIAGIAIVGIGGFALFWFVIKKKSWADLLKIFSK